MQKPLFYRQTDGRTASHGKTSIRRTTSLAGGGGVVIIIQYQISVVCIHMYTCVNFHGTVKELIFFLD